MIPRGLLCAALLLASPALAFSEQAAAQSDTPSAPHVQAVEAPEKPDAGAFQPDDFPPEAEGTPGAPPRPLRMDCTPAPQARKLVGQYGCVSGRVYRIVFTHKGNIRLYLCPNRQCPFHATIYEDDVEKVGSVLHLRGRLIAVDGDVKLYRGVPEIKVSDRDQISVAAGGSHDTDMPPPRTVKEKRKREVPSKKAW